MGKLKRKNVTSEFFVGTKRYGRALRQGLGSSGLGWEEEGDMPVKILGGGEDSFKNILWAVLIPFPYSYLHVVLRPLFPSPSPPSPDSPPCFTFSFHIPPFVFIFSKKNSEEGEGGKEEKGESTKRFLSREKKIKNIWSFMSRVLYGVYSRGEEQKEKTEMGWCWNWKWLCKGGFKQFIIYWRFLIRDLRRFEV